MPEQGFQRRAAGRVEKMKEKEKNTVVKLKEGIDGLMLIVKKLRQLIDQKDERIKELSRKLQAAIKKTQLNNRIKK
jgi:flagellar biosynthesis chaperone FliJ